MSVDPLLTGLLRSPSYATHSCLASIRTLCGRQWARCKLESDLKPRSITMVTDPGCWGCYLAGDL
jgi:hypothetical protein